MLLTLTGFLAAGIGAFFGVAQSVRTVRQRTTAGVSRASWMVSATGAAMWLTYGVLERSGPQLLANIPWFVSVVLIGVFMAREEVLHSRVALVLPWAMLGVGFVLLSAERTALAVVGPLIGLGITIPQLLSMRQASSVEGVSILAWTTSVVSGALWVSYGFGLGDVAVVLSSLTATTMNCLVLFAVTAARRRSEVVTEDGLLELVAA